VRPRVRPGHFNGITNTNFQKQKFPRFECHATADFHCSTRIRVFDTKTGFDKTASKEWVLLFTTKFIMKTVILCTCDGLKYLLIVEIP